MTLHNSRSSVAVLGAGLTGVSTALELARSGLDVVLVDQDERALNRTSLRNEGKIHLGLIYANEGSLDTAKLQLRGALLFRSLLERWVGPMISHLGRSSPFVYLVADSSLCDPAQLEAHYAEVDALYRRNLFEDPSLDYLGERPEMLYSRLSDCSPYLATSRVVAGFSTAEVAIDTDKLVSRLRYAVSRCSKIRLLAGHRVDCVTRRGEGLCVEGTNSEGVWRHQADQVVNALWDGRIAIDRTYGMASEPGWIYRLKYRVIARLPSALHDAPSATMVLGPYGDVVIRPDGTSYLSWYPAGLQGWSNDVSPPAVWEAACRGIPSLEKQAEVARATLSAIDSWYPGIGKAEPLLVDAGVIVGHGRTDIGDKKSGLHGRAKVGLRSDNGYHSVDPGKLTTAPLFGFLAATAVLEH